MKCFGVFVAIVAFQCISASPALSALNIGGVLGGAVSGATSDVSGATTVVSAANNAVSGVTGAVNGITGSPVGNILNATRSIADILNNDIGVVGGILQGLEKEAEEIFGTVEGTVSGATNAVSGVTGAVNGVTGSFFGYILNATRSIADILNNDVGVVGGILEVLEEEIL